MSRILYLSAIAVFVFGDFGVCLGKPLSSGDTNFDYLVFAQQWPVTNCMDWRRKNSSNTCTMPKDPNLFTIHGLWPSSGGNDGPNYCRSQPKYDAKILAPIMNDMNNRWTNIQKGTSSNAFWGHEWSKHGTCAMILPQCNGVYKYFKTALDFNVKYDVAKALADYGVTPGPQLYNINDFINAIVKKFNKIPQVYCTLDSNGNASLNELRLCFDNSFQLIDCTSVHVNPKNCKGNKSLRYPKTVSNI